MNIFLWFALIIVLLWFFIMYIFPLIVKRYLRKMSEKFNQHQSRESKTEGSINIDYIPKTKNKDNTPGEYVNYEDINEK